jgi:hypothetical protein
MIATPVTRAHARSRQPSLILGLVRRKAHTTMDDEKPLASQIARLCDLQEQQLTKLTELVERFTRIADGSQRSHEIYAEQAKTWEEDRKEARERQEEREKRTLRHGIIIMIILALIPVAIIIAHFL